MCREQKTREYHDEEDDYESDQTAALCIDGSQFRRSKPGHAATTAQEGRTCTQANTALRNHGPTPAALPPASAVEIPGASRRGETRAGLDLGPAGNHHFLVSSPLCHTRIALW